MAVFPDVHHKMSKKIAQLTKVIYHLNTKNDDNEFQMRQLVDMYEREIADVIGDARRKIIAFKDQLESKQGEERYQAAIRELEREHQREREESMSRFTAFKRQAAEGERKLREEAEGKLRALAAEVKAAKDEFQRRMHLFGETERGIEQRGAGALEELRELKDKEIEDTVQEYNEKYKAMLAEQLRAQDELEKDLTRAADEKLDRLRADHAKHLARVDQQLESERARVAELQAQLARETARAEKTQGEAKGASSALRKLEENEVALNERLAATLAQLAATEKALEMSRSSDGDARARLEQQAGRIASLQDEITHSLSRQKALSGEGSELSQRLAELQDQLQRTQLDLDMERQAGEAQRDANRVAVEDGEKVRGQCTALEGIVAGLKEEVAAVEAALAESKQAAESAAQAASTALSAAERRLEEHKSETAQRIAGLERDLSLSRASSDDAQRSLLASVEQRLEALRETGASELAAERESSKAALAELDGRLQRERVDALEQLRRTHEEECSRLSADIAAAQASASSLTEQLERERMEAEAAASAAATAAEEAATARAESEESLQQQLAALEQCLQQKEELIAAALAQVRDEASKAEQERQRALGVEKDLREKAGTLQMQLGEKEALLLGKQQELTSTVAQLGSTKERELRELERQKEASFRQDLDRELATLREALTARLGRERDAALAAAEEERRRLGEAAGSVEDGLRKDLAKALEDGKSMQGKLDAVRKEREDEQSSWRLERARLVDERKTREEEMKNTFARQTAELRRELAAGYDSALSKLKQQHEAELQAATTKHADALRKAEQESQKAIRDLRSSSEADLQAKLKAASDRHSDETQALGAKHREELYEVRAKHADAVSALERQLSAKARSIDDLEASLAAAKLRADEDKRAHADQLAVAVETRTRERQEACRQLDDTRHRYEQELSRLRASHDQSVSSLTAQFEQVQQKMREGHGSLQAKVRDLQHMYDTRPSREEDVLRINELMEELRTKDDALLKAYNDLKWYKLELVNREESYNKVFGRQPHVQSRRPPVAAASADADQRQGAWTEPQRRNTMEPRHGAAIPSITALGGGAEPADGAAADPGLRRAATGQVGLGR